MDENRFTSPNYVIKELICAINHVVMYIFSWLSFTRGQITIWLFLRHFYHFKCDSDSIEAFSRRARLGNKRKWRLISLAAVSRSPARQGIKQAQFLCFSKNPFFLRFQYHTKTYIFLNKTFKIHIFQAKKIVYG